MLLPTATAGLLSRTGSGMLPESMRDGSMYHGIMRDGSMWSIVFSNPRFTNSSDTTPEKRSSQVSKAIECSNSSHGDRVTKTPAGNAVDIDSKTGIACHPR
jgi:zona occludens toxin (predicted ATPase)